MWFWYVLQFNEMGDMGGVSPYLASALRGYKTALDAALSAASWFAQPGAGGSYEGGGRPPSDRPPRSDGIEVCKNIPYNLSVHGWVPSKTVMSYYVPSLLPESCWSFASEWSSLVFAVM